MAFFVAGILIKENNVRILVTFRSDRLRISNSLRRHLKSELVALVVLNPVVVLVLLVGADEREDFILLQQIRRLNQHNLVILELKQLRLRVYERYLQEQKVTERQQC